MDGIASLHWNVNGKVAEVTCEDELTDIPWYEGLPVPVRIG